VRAHPASEELALAAEKNTAWIRVAVIFVNVPVYLFFLDHAGTIPALAYAISTVAVAYGLFNAVFRPYRRFPALRSAQFTSVTDAALITLWLHATGGFDSPFYLLWYASIAAIAFRFGPRVTLPTIGLYSGTYVGLLALEGELVAHWPIVFLRVAYIVFVGLLGALLSREALLQTRARLEMRDAMLETKRAGEAVRESEKKLRSNLSLLNATLDSTADGLLVVDSTGRIASFNRRFVQMWRIPDAVIEGRDDARAMSFVVDQLRDPEGFLRKVQELYARPESQSFDVLDFKDDRIFERYSQPQWLDGRIVGRVWSFRDVTERRRTEAERLARLEQEKEVERLRELDAFKTRFVNTFAHELGTPLTPIKIQLHLLSTRYASQLGLEGQHAVEMLDRNFERLRALVGEMLEGARLQAGRLRIQRERIDLAHVVRDAVDDFRDPAQSVGLQLSARISDPVFVQGDATRLTQVMFNLLSNALKFTPSGGVIDVSVALDGPRARVCVRDTGAGLTAGQIAALFQPFSQAHDPAQKTRSGSGLGLYICKGILEAHGGRIWVESDGPGRGASFLFDIPLAPIVRSASAGLHVTVPPPSP
jgi:signal transduction histidine kinase